MIYLESTSNITNFEKGPIRRSLFSNGAVSLFHKMKGRKVAVVNLYFLAGSIFEKEEEYGIAHVLEHMLFKESASSNIVRELEFLGADINAYTSKEFICFELSCISSKLHLFLEKFLILFLNPSFNLKELSLEKKVIVQELREDKDDHETEAIEYMYAKNFDSNIGHSVGGSIRNVKQFKKGDVLSFYNRFFSANRMVLSIVSGNNFDSLEEICAKTFKSSRKTKHYRLGQSNRYGALTHFKSKLKRSMENSILMLSFDGVSLESKHYYDLLVLDELLFGGLSSKFFELLREKLGLIYSLGSSINSYVKTGSYVMVFNTSKSNIKQLKLSINTVLEYYTENFFDESEILGIINRIKEGWEISFDEPIGRCEYIALEELYGTHNYSVDKMVEKLNLVDAKSINKLLKRMLKNGHSELVVGP